MVPRLTHVPVAARALLAATVLLGTHAGLASTGERAAWDQSSYAVSRWDMKDGLPLNKVRAVAQTPDGYLWVGTFNGLARFDGVRFKTFDVANTPALGNNAIESLAVDATGRLWIGDNSGGLSVCDQGRFQRIALPAGWPASPVLRLVPSRDGTIWAASEGALLAWRDGATPRVFPLRVNPSLFAIDSEGGAWVAIAGQLRRLRQTTGLASESSLALDGRWQAVFPARQGGLWILHEGRLRRWQHDTWVEDRGQADWGTIVLAAFIETHDGRIIGGSFKEGVTILSPDGTRERIDETRGLAHNWVYCLAEDREGTVWLGTGNGGLQSLNPRRITMVDSPDHWRSSAVLSVAPASTGGLWVGTEGGGVYRLERGTIRSLPGREGMWQAVANSVCEDQRGRLWVGTWSSALRYLDQGEFKPAYHGTDGHNVVLTVFEARDGTIWVGTRSGPGRLRDGNIEWVGEPEALRLAAVRCFAETADGALWCGTDGAGVFEITANRTRQYQRGDGLAGNHIRTLFSDTDGAIWIGTRSGLSRFKGGRFATLTTRQGLPSNVICQILDDGRGCLWMGSLGGVLRIAREDLNRCADGQEPTLKCLVCDLSSGLATLEMSEQGQPAGCRTSDGRLWFATGKGLAMVVPANVRENPLPPPVRIEELVVDGEPVALPPAAPAGDRAAAIAEPVAIPAGGRQFEFRYTGLSLTNPGRVGFRYRLEGLHDDWLDAGTRRSAVYTQLAPGHYVFHVSARNADGVWNESGASLALRVLPHFWQTWWFKATGWLGSLLAVALGMLVVVRDKARRRVEAAERQRALEQERGRIARDIHDDLGSSLTRIVMLSESARAGLEKSDAAAELGEVCQTGRDLTLQLSEIVWAINPAHDTLDSFANYAGDFARNFLERAGLRCRLDVPVALPALPLDSPVRHNLFLAFKEALNNAVKHAAARSVFVTLHLSERELTVTVEDDGRGFVAAARPTGNGLGNMARRLADIGGRCVIESEPGRGTRVAFILPRPKLH